MTQFHFHVDVVDCRLCCCFFMTLSTPAAIIPVALKTVSLKVDILDFNHKYLMLGSGN